VQTVYPLSENTGLALTTARYYTPSGRLIQRNYENKSFFDYYYRKDLESKNTQDKKMTDSGRTVYGGGGIAPDEKYTPDKVNAFQRKVWRKYAFFNFTAKYFGTHSTDLPKNWAPDQEVMNEFHHYLLDNGVEFTEAEWAENVDWLRRQLRREMYITAFGADDSRRLAIETDPLVLKAIQSLPKAKALLEKANRIIAQRNQRASDH